jgi:hypothetical protein
MTRTLPLLTSSVIFPPLGTWGQITNLSPDKPYVTTRVTSILSPRAITIMRTVHRRIIGLFHLLRTRSVEENKKSHKNNLYPTPDHGLLLFSHHI